VYISFTYFSSGLKDDPKRLLVAAVGEHHPLVAIAGCVSNFRQWNDDRTVYVGPGNAIGLLQIPMRYQKEIERRGDNPWTLEGNIKAAIKLYTLYGTLPWMGDKIEVDCWSRQLRDFRVFLTVTSVLSEPVPIPERYKAITTKV